MILKDAAIFIVFLGTIVFFHELGHFLFARFFGVRVEVFSIGFGPKLFRKKWGDTEYAVSLFPLGGYVKMFGDDPFSEEELAPEEAKVAFTRQSKWAKFWIVFGGPLANFLLAFVIYFLLVMGGEKVPEARLGVVAPDSKLHSLGLRSADVLKNINTTEIMSFDDLNLVDSNISSIEVYRGDKVEKLDVKISGMDFINAFSISRAYLRAPFVINIQGEKFYISANKELNYKKAFEQVLVTVKDRIYLYPVTKDLTKIKSLAELELEKEASTIIELNTGENVQEQLHSLGFYPLDMAIRSVQVGSPADKSKIQKNNIIVEINNKPIITFEQLRSAVNKLGDNESVTMKVLQSGVLNEISVTPELKEVNGQKAKIIGVVSAGVSQPSNLVERDSRGLVDSVKVAAIRTYDGIHKTLLGFKKLITGELSGKQIGSFLSIGKAASDYFDISLSMYFRLMALISINLGLINLFPIPVLDGGHIVFLGLEVLNRGPLSKKKMQLAQQFGMSLLLLLMVFAVYNDIAKFVF